MADATDAYIRKQHQGRDRNPARTTKLFSNYLYKAAIVVVFLVILPLFTSQPPEFINQTVPNRSWEILHIVFVGIAVSYGLFSKRNEEDGDKEKNGNPSKFDNAQSFVSRFLQLSSVFDDESDGSPSGSDEGRTQTLTWNSQYFRNEPMLVVAQEHPGPAIGEDRGGHSSRISEKPLLLPVRSLRSRVSEESRGASDEPSLPPVSLSRSGSNSGSSSRRAPNGLNRPRSGRFSDSGYPEEVNVKDSVVLRSPIPWRSRSGRMEIREGSDSLDTFEMDHLEPRSIRPQVSRSSSTSSRTSSSSSSPPSPSLQSPKKSSPSLSLSSEASEAKMIADPLRKKSSVHKSHIPVPPPPPPPPTMSVKLPPQKPSLVSPVNGVLREKDTRNNLSSEYRDIGRGNAKSVRTIRASGETVQGSVTRRDPVENFFDRVIENEERRQEFLKKMIIDSEDEETQTEGDNDDSDDDRVADEDPGVPKNCGVVSNIEKGVSNGVSEGGPDVDKKADEFIAKFREQIRLQRIESIKRSSAEISKNSSR